VQRVGESGGLPDRRVTALAVDGERAYIGTALGIAEVRDGQVTRRLGEGLFATALAVRGDTLVAGTLEGTIARIPLAPGASRGARPLEQDAPGTIARFVSTGDALYAVTGAAVFLVEEEAGLRQVLGGDTGQLTDGNVSALALDRQGRLWVGYFDRGLDLLDATGARLVHAEDDHIFCVNRIVHDPEEGLTAVATANGLALFDASGRQRQLLGRADGLIADHVTDLLLRPGGMAVATPAGLTLLDSRGGRSLSAFHGLVSNHVYALGAAGGTLVAGTLGGVSVLENDVVHATYTAANSSLTHNWITAIARVGDGWFAGTYGGGVVRLDRDGRPEPFADLPGQIEINPNAMAVTATHVFAGTLAKGLLVYDRDRGRWERFENGLPSMNVTALAGGPDALYVGTDNGIVKVAYTAFAR
jgi:ligand-binding sensor domain-containing protein